MVMLGSCKKALEIKPKDFLSASTYFNTEADATAALGAAWDMLTRGYMYQGNYQYRMVTADDCWTALSPNFPSNLGVQSDFSYYNERWKSLYTTIEYCNILLQNLPRVKMDEGKKGIIRGEGLFLRAFIYYELVKDWGAVPMRLEPTAGPNDLNIASTPVKDIYSQILKDMISAEGLVPNTSVALYGGAGYAAKTTVQAMLARVCLQMAGEPLKDLSKYQDAKNWAQKVVDSREHALNPDYTKIFINYAQNIIDKKESLWEVDFNYVSGTTEHGNIGYLDGIAGASGSFGSGAGQFKVTRKLFNSYGGTAASTKDTRRDWNCALWTWKNTTTTGAETDKTYFPTTQTYQRFLAKYRVYLSPPPIVNGQTVINYPLMRYSDVLLMLAEAENYLNGPSDLAYSSINQVRARAYGKLMPGATNLTEFDLPRTFNKDTFLGEIQNERLREFPGESIRKYDLLRWGIFIQSIKQLGVDVTDPAQPVVPYSTSGGQPYPNMLQLANTVSTRDLLWPIPALELQYNKLLTQNFGW